jgi:hypothetical protein
MGEASKMSLGTRARITTVLVILQDNFFHDMYALPDKFEQLDDEAHLLAGMSLPARTTVK